MYCGEKFLRINAPDRKHFGVELIVQMFIHLFFILVVISFLKQAKAERVLSKTHLAIRPTREEVGYINPDLVLSTEDMFPVRGQDYDRMSPFRAMVAIREEKSRYPKSRNTIKASGGKANSAYKTESRSETQRGIMSEADAQIYEQLFQVSDVPFRKKKQFEMPVDAKIVDLKDMHH